MDYYLDRYHSSGNGMDENSVGLILKELSSEILTCENLLETVAEKEKMTERLVIFHQKWHECRHFPRLNYNGGDRVTIHVNLYLTREDLADSCHTHFLQQLSIAIVLSCLTSGFVNGLMLTETYETFQKNYPLFSKKTDEFYHLLLQKLNIGNS